MKKIGFIMVGLLLLFLVVDGVGSGLYFDGVLDVIFALGWLLVGLALIAIDSEDEKILKKIGFFLVGLFLLLFPITGFNFEDVFDVIFRIGLLLIGLALIFNDIRLSSGSFTARTPSRPEHPGPGHPPPPKVEPPGETLPPGVWKCPVCETFVDDEASVCLVCGYSRTQQQ